MAVRTIVDLPEALHAELVKRAERSGRSLELETVGALTQFLGDGEGEELAGQAHRPRIGPIFAGTGERGPLYPSDENPHDLVFE